MKATETNSVVELEKVTALIARKLLTGRSTVFPYADSIDILSDLFAAFGCPASRLIAVGHVTPDIAQAADRASCALEEQMTASPFAGDPTAVTRAVKSPRDIIYVANPNRVTGATYSLSELELMTSAVPEGALVVDEHYFDYFGVTAGPLTELHSNAVCLRAPAAAHSTGSTSFGFVLGAASAIDRIAQIHSGHVFSRTLGRTVEGVLTNDEALTQRVDEVRKESLRIVKALEAFELQGRLSPTDFVLMRVADPKQFGNALARDRIAIENLDGYPQLKNYVRYRIESRLANDRLIQAVERMTPDFYRMKTRDGRPARVIHPVEARLVSSARQRHRLFGDESVAGTSQGRRANRVKTTLAKVE